MSRATIYRKIHEYGIVTPARPHDITPQLEPRHAAGAEHARWVTAALMRMLAGQLARPGPPAGALTHAFRALAG
jgi:hypothetical protein